MVPYILNDETPLPHFLSLLRADKEEEEKLIQIAGIWWSRSGLRKKSHENIFSQFVLSSEELKKIFS